VLFPVSAFADILKEWITMASRLEIPYTLAFSSLLEQQRGGIHYRTQDRIVILVDEVDFWQLKEFSEELPIADPMDGLTHFL